MKTTIKNRGAESTLTISGDFYQILDENFASVCMAIANKGVILKELIHLFDKDDKAIDTVIQIIMKSHFPQEATYNLQEKVGITELTANYLLNTSLSKLSSMNKKGIEKELAKHKKQIDLIFSSICVQ